MPETGYNYSLTSDFSSGINVDNLTNEIDESSISEELSYITIIGSANQVRIFFVDALSGADQITLNNVVAAHDSTPSVEESEEITTILTKNIVASGATGGVNLEDFNFNHNVVKPIGETGAIQNMIIDADLNTILNIDNDEIKAGAAIDASKIANGLVNNTEFQRLNGIGSALVGISDTQTLTNKTISNANNTIGANELRTTGASVVIDTAAPPTIGELLVASSATTANWQTYGKFDAYNTATQALSTTAAWTAINLDVQRFTPDSDFSHTIGTSDVTINTNGRYLIIGHVSTSNIGSGNRTNSQIRLALNGSQINGTIGIMYNRNDLQGSNSTTVSCIIDLVSTDAIRIEGQRLSGSGDPTTIANACNLIIMRI